MDNFKTIARSGMTVAFKLLLSCLAAGVFILLLQIMQWWAVADRLASGTPAAPRQENLAASSRATPETGQQTFWPHFPGSANGVTRQIKINGVDIICENWQTATPAAEVIAYYKPQMIARRWRDDTEQFLHMRPEFRSQETGENGLQDPFYLKLYDSLLSTSVVLHRNGWSLQIVAAPSAGGIRQTDVRIVAAATPSLEDFGQALLSMGGPESTNTLDTVQELAGQQYHTIISVKNAAPALVFAEILKKYDSRHWKSLAMYSDRPGHPGYFASLINGRAYATISVSPRPNHGSSLTLTEVAPGKTTDN